MKERLIEWRKDISAGVLKLLKLRGTLGWLGLVTAIASAVATAYSYFVSKQAAEVTAKALAFSEQVNREQVALGRPVLTISSARLVSWEEGDASYGRKSHSRLEVTVRNSGGRSALPGWVALYEWSSFFDAAPATWKELPERGLEVWDVPAGGEVKVGFDVSSPTAKYLVGLAFGDEIPGPPARSAGNAAGASVQLHAVCSIPKIVVIEMLDARQRAVIPLSGDFSAVTPVIGKAVGTTGPATQASVAFGQMQATVLRDGRCAVGDTN